MKTLLNKEFKNAPSLNELMDKAHGLWNTPTERWRKCHDYKDFLKTPLTLSMLIPCDSEGNVLEEPEKGRNKKFDSHDTHTESIVYHEDWHKRLDQYQKAMEQVIFKGLSTYETERSGYTYMSKKGMLGFYIFKYGKNNDNYTISDLIGQPINQTFFNEII